MICLQPVDLPYALAGDEVVLGELLELRCSLEAVLAGEAAARSEAACVLGINGACELALEYLPFLLVLDGRNGDGGEQRFGIGVPGVAEEFLGGRLLYHLAQVHYAYVVRNVLYY